MHLKRRTLADGLRRHENALWTTEARLVAPKAYSGRLPCASDLSHLRARTLADDLRRRESTPWTPEAGPVAPKNYGCRDTFI